MRACWDRPFRKRVKVIHERDGGICGICSLPVALDREGADEPSIDHIVPLSRGGTDDESNLQLAHGGCNSGKCNRTNEEYREFREWRATATERLSIPRAIEPALYRIASELGITITGGRYTGHPRVSRLLDMIAEGELVVSRAPVMPGQEGE